MYGTLRDGHVQQRLLGRRILGADDELGNYELSSVRLGMRTYPMIQPRPGGAVTGVVLEVSAEELSALDEYETEAYQRSRVTLQSGAHAWVYHRPLQPG